MVWHGKLSLFKQDFLFSKCFLKHFHHIWLILKTLLILLSVDVIISVYIMKSECLYHKKSTEIEFKYRKRMFCCSDGFSHATRHSPEVHQLQILKNITDLLSIAFKTQFVFPAIGHDDPNQYEKLSSMWSRWLPSDSKKSFETGKKLLKKGTLKFVILSKLVATSN